MIDLEQMRLLEIESKVLLYGEYEGVKVSLTLCEIIEKFKIGDQLIWIFKLLEPSFD